jgi:hypothetical protein
MNPTVDNTQAGLADLDALVLEVGASYPLLAYVINAEEAYDEPTALDPVILAGLITPIG